MPTPRKRPSFLTALLTIGLTALAAAAAGLGAALAAGSPPVSATFEVRLEHLHHGAYRDAGDYPTQFGPADAGAGTWQPFESSTGAQELALIQNANTASGMVEVHLEALTGGAYQDIGDYVSHITTHRASYGFLQLVGSAGGAPELALIKTANTPSKMVNVILETLRNGSYQDVGDYRSDFPATVAPNGTWQMIATAGAPDLAFIDTSSGQVSVHLDALTGASYQRVADYSSGFSATGAGANAIWRLFGSSGGAPELGSIGLGPGPIQVSWETLRGGAYQKAGSYASVFSPSLAGQGTWDLLGPGPRPLLALVQTPAPPPPTTTTTQTVTTVVTQPLPTPPPPKPHKRGHVRARMVISYHYYSAHTRILRVRVTGFPRRARIDVRCYGRGCPRLAVTAGYRRLGGALRSLGGRVLRAGDLLKITVSAPGLLPEQVGLRIRNGAKPQARLF